MNILYYLVVLPARAMKKKKYPTPAPEISSAGSFLFSDCYFQKLHIAVWSVLSRIDISVPFVCPVGEAGYPAGNAPQLLASYSRLNFHHDFFIILNPMKIQFEKVCNEHFAADRAIHTRQTFLKE